MNFYLSENFIDWTEKYLSTVLAFCIVALSFMYVYFINSSVFNAVIREQNDQKISQMTADIGNLENSYISLKGSINLDMARAVGFEDDFSKVHFSSENTSVTGNLSLLGNEI